MMDTISNLVREMLASDAASRKWLTVLAFLGGLGYLFIQGYAVPQEWIDVAKTVVIVYLATQGVVDVVKIIVESGK